MSDRLELSNITLPDSKTYYFEDDVARLGIGAPLKAATIAEMTDTSKVYVYVGNETGYHNGHWYYYDDPTWTDGGVYNAVAVQTDPTLTVPDTPADAWATGEAIRNVKSAIDTAKAPIIIDSASGGIASFSDGADNILLKELIVNVEPVQDLHGYDNPWPAGGGKNLFDASDAVIGSGAYSLSITQTGDVYRVSGTVANSGASNPSFVVVNLNTADLSGKGYVVQTFPAGTGNTHSISSWGLRTENETNIAISIHDAPNGSVVDVSFRISVSATSQTEWTPYSNICPISGWTGATVTRAGKNLFDTTERVTGQTDVNGNTSSGYALTEDTLSISKDVFNYGRVMLSAMSMKSGNYVLSFKAYISGSGYIRCSVRNMGANPKADIVNPVNKNAGEISIPFSLTENADVAISIQPENNAAGTVTISDIQLEYGSTASTYEPYQGDTYAIQLGDTIYGGTLDVTNGKMVVDRALVDLGTLNYGYNAIYKTFGAYKGDIKAHGICISSQYKYGDGVGAPDMTCCLGYDGWFINNIIIKDSRYTDAVTFKSAMSGVQLIYELATPIEITLTVRQIETLLGTNNIWADAGTVDVDYPADTKLFIQRIID